MAKCNNEDFNFVVFPLNKQNNIKKGWCPFYCNEKKDAISYAVKIKLYDPTLKVVVSTENNINKENIVITL